MKSFKDPTRNSSIILSEWIILLLVLVSLSCSQKSSKIQSSAQRLEILEKEIDSLAKAKEFEKVQPLIIELNTLKWEVILQNPYWKERSYEKILDELSKQYILTEFDDFIPSSTDTYKTILQIFPKNNDPKNLNRVRWNMEDVNKIKKIIVNILTFDPEVDGYGSMVWTASKFDIEIAETGSKDIRIEFLTKE